MYRTDRKIVGISPELHGRAKAAAALKQLPLREWVEDAIRRKLKAG